MADSTVDPHRRFSVECFNRAWALIRLPSRSAEENEHMLLLAMTSLWHWQQRPECTSREHSIGCWQVSRTAALAGHPSLARFFGEQSLHHARELSPFFQGFAHEALARAASVAGDFESFEHHVDESKRCAAMIADAEERRMLHEDIESLVSDIPA